MLNRFETKHLDEYPHHALHRLLLIMVGKGKCIHSCCPSQEISGSKSFGSCIIKYEKLQLIAEKYDIVTMPSIQIHMNDRYIVTHRYVVNEDFSALIFLVE